MVARDRTSPCIRCGVARKTESKGRRLCRDCRAVLSEAEWAIWNDQEPPVESYHEKEAA